MDIEKLRQMLADAEQQRQYHHDMALVCEGAIQTLKQIIEAGEQSPAPTGEAE